MDNIVVYDSIIWNKGRIHEGCIKFVIETKVNKIDKEVTMATV